jgi:hypothetical protein
MLDTLEYHYLFIYSTPYIYISIRADSLQCDGWGYPQG